MKKKSENREGETVMTTQFKAAEPDLQRKQRLVLPKTLMILLTVILVEIALAVAALFIVIYSGAYNVAATAPHFESTVWILSTTMDHSVRQHASGVVVSEVFKTPDLAVGYKHYSEMCVFCHGAPGVQRSEMGDGLYPRPPDLMDAAGEELIVDFRTGLMRAPATDRVTTWPSPDTRPMGQHASGFHTVRVLSRIEQILIGKF
ncbi:MAG: hypothetical protein WA151_14260 [Desulfatirhabdiaceae bacterium]